MTVGVPEKAPVTDENTTPAGNAGEAGKLNDVGAYKMLQPLTANGMAAVLRVKFRKGEGA
jgi:hypothetical protein